MSANQPSSPTRLRMPRILIAGLLALAIGYALKPAERLPAGETVTEPFEGVRYVHRIVDAPRRIDMNIVIIDLQNQHLRFEVTADNGEGRGKTFRETASHFVKRLGAQIGINGGFFGERGLTSLSASKGQPVSPWHPTARLHNNGINISRDNKVTFISPPADHEANGFLTDPAVPLYNALSGNVRLLTSGTITARPKGDTTYPQTAMALTGDNKLILFVADGRRPEFSHGMTYEEVAMVLKSFGAVDAIALDGGGSATLVFADQPGRKPRVINHPSDGRERPVGNNLAVFVQQRAR